MISSENLSFLLGVLVFCGETIIPKGRRGSQLSFKFTMRIPGTGGAKMIQTTVKVSGMACSMCEAHINDAIRAAFSVEKVSSSHSKGETVILSQAPLDENALRTAIDATGYMAGEISTAVYEKKGFFHFGNKKH